MQEQKSKAMASWKGSGEKEVAPFYKDFAQNSSPTEFNGYLSTEGEAKVLAILKNGNKLESAKKGDC
ncbi:MAG: hypothetical protein Ct9H300mP23_03280 [Nitrospinota bacterium]|nr:MAG: hypothetical protein Ct9H300mP23_03280 [Nitrospinota bacterium]